MTEAIAPTINRRTLGLRFLQLAAALAVPGSALARTPGAHDVAVETDVMVAMRDGVRLATDIYRPARNGAALPGPFPVILERTPYGKSGRGLRHASIEVARFYASHGYAVVFQDCRGRGASEGEYVKYLSNGDDGFDCCAWINGQPWANGRIGMQGLSYGAHTTCAAACAGAPGVSALFLDSGGFSNAYQGGIRQGGAFELKQATWAFNAAMAAPEIRDDPEALARLRAVDIKDWFRRWPWSRGNSPLKDAPDYESYLFDQWENGDFNAYWKQVGIYAEGFYDTFSDAPMIWMSSWYDPYPRTATDNYVALKGMKSSPVRLILGPWTHGNNHQTFAGDVDFGPRATLAGNVATDLVALRKTWFDRHLKGDAEAPDIPPVQIFVMGGGSGRRTGEGRMDHGGRWRAEADWPLPGARDIAYHLHADGRLAPDAPTETGGALSYRYDPRHPTPSIGGTITSGQPIMAGGAFDQREGPDFYGSEVDGRALADRPDVLVFQTPPLTEDVEVTGPVEADLWISSDCLDTDFTIKLVDVYPANEDYPQGYAMNITDGILRCRYRDSWETPSLMTPGQVYRIRVSAFPTSNLFKAGHRIRLDVASCNFPHFDLNPNSGEPEGRWRTLKVATNTVHLDRDRPSRVILPIAPRRA